MALLSSELLEFTPHKSGKGRARYRFVFDNRELIIGSIFVSNEAEALAKLPEIETRAIENASRLDSNNQTEIIDSGEASKVDVAKAFLQKAMLETEAYKAFDKLKKFNDYRIEQGYTVPQVKAALQLTDKQWDAIAARWQYFQSNEAAIQAYQVVASSDPGAN